VARPSRTHRPSSASKDLTLHALALMVSGLASCGGFTEVPAQALYPNADRPRPREEVARVQGPIELIDGKKVKGNAFDVLPGCHVVTLPSKLGDVNEQGAWWVDLPHTVYAFRMRAGGLYSIEVDGRGGNAQRASVKITARERDAKGAILKIWQPVQGDQEIEACRQWEKELTRPALAPTAPAPVSAPAPAVSPTPTPAPADAAAVGPDAP
jgi:hypothetical protein